MSAWEKRERCAAMTCTDKFHNIVAIFYSVVTIFVTKLKKKYSFEQTVDFQNFFLTAIQISRCLASKRTDIFIQIIIIVIPFCIFVLFGKLELQCRKTSLFCLPIALVSSPLHRRWNVRNRPHVLSGSTYATRALELNGASRFSCPIIDCVEFVAIIWNIHSKCMKNIRSKQSQPRKKLTKQED